MQFDADDLAFMRDVQEYVMQDTCVIWKYTELDPDIYGNVQHQYEEGDSSDCGFDPTASKEVMEGTQVAVTDAVVRLPISLHGSIDQHDRVQITHRFGVALDTPVAYELIGLPERGPSGLVVNLRLITDGSM